jgi:hypothetical protein
MKKNQRSKISCQGPFKLILIHYKIIRTKSAGLLLLLQGISIYLNLPYGKLFPYFLQSNLLAKKCALESENALLTCFGHPG